MNPMPPMTSPCQRFGAKRGVAPWRPIPPARHALVLALVAAGLAGCGADPHAGLDITADTAVTASTTGRAGAAAPAIDRSHHTADTPMPAVDPPTAASPQSDAAAPPAGSLLMTLLPFGEMPLPDGRVERSYRLQLHNSGSPLPAATLELAEVPPGVEVVRGRIGTTALAARASSTPSETLILRFRETAPVDVSSLAWRWMAAAPNAAHAATRLLVGDPAAAAVSALATLAPVRPEGGGERLLALLAPHARVGEVNAALRRTQLHIDEMRPGNHTLVLKRAALGAVPLTQVAAQLEASGAFERVTFVGSAAQSFASAAVSGSTLASAVRRYDGTDPDACSD